MRAISERARVRAARMVEREERRARVVGGKRRGRIGERTVERTGAR
jgi:hypothetical protein